MEAKVLKYLLSESDSAYNPDLLGGYVSYISSVLNGVCCLCRSHVGKILGVRLINHICMNVTPSEIIHVYVFVITDSQGDSFLNLYCDDELVEPENISSKKCINKVKIKSCEYPGRLLGFTKKIFDTHEIKHGSCCFIHERMLSYVVISDRDIKFTSSEEELDLITLRLKRNLFKDHKKLEEVYITIDAADSFMDVIKFLKDCCNTDQELFDAICKFSHNKAKSAMK